MPHRFTLLLVACLAVLFPTLRTAGGPVRAAKPVRHHTDRFGDPLPQGAVARLGSVRLHHQGGVLAAAFAPDAKTIVVAGYEKEGLALRFWETATGKELFRRVVKGSEFTGLTFAADGKTVFVGRYDAVEQYDRQSGKLLSRFTESGYYSFVLSPDGKWLAIHSHAEKAPHASIFHLREIATGQKRISLKGQRSACYQCRWSADGKRFLSASYSERLPSGEGYQKTQGSLCVWDVAAGKKLHEFPNDDYEVALAGDGQTAALRDQDGKTRVVNLTTGQTICTLPVDNSSLEFTPDSKALVAVNSLSSASPRLWDITTGKELHRLQAQPFERQRLPVFSADGKWLMVIADEWVLLWDVATGEPLHTRGRHRDTVTSVAFTADGKLVASGSLDTTVRFWDPASGKQLGRLDGHPSGVTAVAFSGDGKTLASSSKDGSIRLWDVAKRRELANLSGPQDGAASLRFSADGKTLIAAGNTGVIQVWKWVECKKTAAFSSGHGDAVFAFSRDGKLALSARRSEDQTWIRNNELHLWRLPAGKQLLSVDLRSAERNQEDIVCESVALSADGRWLAASHRRVSHISCIGTRYADHTVRIWEGATGQEWHRIPDTTAQALAFSPDGRLLVLGHGDKLTFKHRNARANRYSPDSRVTFWDMATGEMIRVCQGHTNEVACVAFSADGKLLASGSAEHTILIWAAVRPAPLQPALARPTAKQLGFWWDDLRGDAPLARAATVQWLARADLTVPWIRACVKPTPPVDNEYIGSLITALNSPRFKDRQQATVALEALGEIAEGRLQQLLAGNPHLEYRRRAELLLAKLEEPLSPEQLRTIRAVAILEWIGTAEARELLGILAQGEPKSRQTRLAQAARSRMDE